MAEESILSALVEIERDELAKYCTSITMNGEIAQSATITLAKGQTLWASKGSLLAYSETIDWTLKMPKGGAGKMFGRVMSGESLSLAHVTARAEGEVTISANQAGKLVTWDLSRGPIICTTGAFVAAVGDVDIDVTTAASAGAAFFGGGGLFLQKLSGEGIVFVHGSGDFIEKQLKPYEKLLVSTGNLAVFSNTVKYNVRGVGGCWKALRGGEGLFMTELTGPGWVMLQSLKKLPVPQQPR